jgi:hypothetical protein
MIYTYDYDNGCAMAAKVIGPNGKDVFIIKDGYHTLSEHYTDEIDVARKIAQIMNENVEFKSQHDKLTRVKRIVQALLKDDQEHVWFHVGMLKGALGIEDDG